MMEEPSRSFHHEDSQVLSLDNKDDDEEVATDSTSSSTHDETSSSSDGDDSCSTCGVFDLPSGIVMVDEEEEEEEEEESMRVLDPKPCATTPRLPTLVPRRVPLPPTRGVSRQRHAPENCFVYEIPRVLSLDECRELIETARTSALPSNTAKASSSSFRYVTHAVHTAPDGITKFEVALDQPNPHKLAVFSHREWVDRLWERLKPLLVTNKLDKKENGSGNPSSSGPIHARSLSLPEAMQSFIERESLAIPSRTTPVAGLNPRLRVLKYDATDADEFLGHYDATTERHGVSQQTTSYWTVLLYLNDGGGIDFAGGETEFLSQPQHEASERRHREHNSVLETIVEEEEEEENDDDGHEINGNTHTTRITPQAGSVVLFEHDLFHRGRPLTWGTKYVVRTDVMFANPPPPCDGKPSAWARPELNSCEAPRVPTPSVPTTVEGLLGQLASELEDHQLLLLREALCDGLGFADLADTSLGGLCAPGRVPLTLMLREHLLPQQQTPARSVQPVIDAFLDAAFAALREQTHRR